MLCNLAPAGFEGPSSHFGTRTQALCLHPSNKPPVPPSPFPLSQALNMTFTLSTVMALYNSTEVGSRLKNTKRYV